VADILVPKLRDTAITDAAGAAGVVVTPLSSFDSAKPHRNGLLLGFAGVGEREIDRATAKLAAVTEGLR
jgi:DNA-binding transcriptional MocR family regulator